MHVHSFIFRSLKDEDSIYTDSNTDGASDNGHSIKLAPSVQDKIVGYSSIAFGVIGFTIFIWFYCTPLFRARRRSPSLKRRRDNFRPLIFAPSSSPSSDTGSEGSSTAVDREKSLVWEPPDRVIHRDLISFPGRTNQGSHTRQDVFVTSTVAARTAAVARETLPTIDLDPFLSSFPTPPPGNLDDQQFYPSYHTPRTFGKQGPAVDSYVICSSIPPRSSSLNALLTKPQVPVTKLLLANDDAPSTSELETSMDTSQSYYSQPSFIHEATLIPSPKKVTCTRDTPAYADLILPRYLQAQSLSEYSFKTDQHSSATHA